MNKQILIILFFFPLISFCQKTYDNRGRIISDQTFDKENNLSITRNYFYNSNNLTHELWYNSQDKLVVRYNYNINGDLDEIIKYSPWVDDIIVTDREKYYYNKKNRLIFSIYNNNQLFTEKIYNSRGDEIYIIHHDNDLKIKKILDSRKSGEYYFQNKGYKSITYSNNVIKEEGFYERSKKEGYWIYYHNNGETKEEGVYYMGEKNETWMEYNMNGEIIRESIWYDGNLQNEVCYDLNNKKIRCQ